MKKALLISVGVVALVIFIVFMNAVDIYNKLVTGKEVVRAQLSQMETQYQRRVDLLPSLMSSVKGVMTQEQTVFTAIADARTKYSGATNQDDKISAMKELDISSAKLLAVAENYPQLKSSDNMQSLMSQFASIEESINAERKQYNYMVIDFNLNIKKFPTNIIAYVFGFTPAAYFESASGSEKFPEIKL